MFIPLLRRAGLLLALAWLPAAHAADCPPDTPGCAGNPSFVAQVVDWRTSRINGGHYVAGTVRYTNRTNRVLVLAHVYNSSVATDDQGNRYGVGSVSGIGQVRGGQVDTQFSLQPGEAAEARFDFRGPGGNTIVGTRFALDQTVREVQRLPANQVKLGREYALHITGLANGMRPEVQAGVSVPAPMPLPAAGATPAPAAPVGDACAGLAHCSSAGAVAVTVNRLTYTSGNNRNGLQLELRFSNRGSEPVILAYRARSHNAVDNGGGAYNSQQAGDPHAGIGVVYGGKADPQFVLRPGESRNATFGAVGYGQRHVTSTTHTLVVEQLEIMPSRQIRSVREYSLNFADVTPGGAGGAKLQQTLQQIKDRLKGK